MPTGSPAGLEVDDTPSLPEPAAVGDAVPAYGQERLTWVDRLGVWLSSRRVRRELADRSSIRLADVGCGFDARMTRTLLPGVQHALVVDVALSAALKAEPGVTAIEGFLPDALVDVPSASVDVVLLLSVLEHVPEPERLLGELRRILVPDGLALINVPSWRGKRWLEWSAFRLGLSQPSSIDDHKRYYDPRDLWPMLVAAGFPPHQIRCFRHKFGLNTFATCGRSRLRRAEWIPGR